MRYSILRSTFTGFLAVVGAAAPAIAADGQFEVNQECAVNTGCFPGDAPGFPVTIDRDEPATYLLTSNLDASVAATPTDTIGIQVLDDDVTIDLNGFAIMSNAGCSPGGCSNLSGGAENAHAITATDGTNYHRTTVRNGRILGIPDTPIELFNGARIIGVTVTSSANGIDLHGSGGLIEDVVLTNNSVSSSNILLFGDGTTIRNVRVYDSDGTGIQAQINATGTTVINATVENLQGTGIFLSDGGVVRDSAANNNSFDGITAGEDALVINNQVVGNGGDGIQIDDSSAALDNTVAGNTGMGIACQVASAGYRGNVLSENNSGGNQASASCTDMGTNICGTNMTCP